VNVINSHWCGADWWTWVAVNCGRQQSQPSPQIYHHLVVQSPMVSTAAIPLWSLLHLTDATFHVTAYAAAFLVTVSVAAVPLLFSVGF